MILKIDEFYKEFYQQGHLDYVLSNLIRFDSVNAWKEWLQTEPIGYFTNRFDWSVLDGKIFYDDEESPEEYSISMFIEMDNGEYLLHSAEASQSMFFHLLDNNKLELIYVD